MDGPGTITWEEFLEDAKRLLVVSDRISDGWEFRGDKVHNNYVVIHVHRIVRSLAYIEYVKICKSAVIYYCQCGCPCVSVNTTRNLYYNSRIDSK